MNPTDDYNITDADILLAPMFPCELKYMDLSVLKLNSMSRVPWTVQIRDEWRALSDYLDHRPKGFRGSVIITGQPGIGKK